MSRYIVRIIQDGFQPAQIAAVLCRSAEGKHLDIKSEHDSDMAAAVRECQRLCEVDRVGFAITDVRYDKATRMTHMTLSVDPALRA